MAEGMRGGSRRRDSGTKAHRLWKQSEVRGGPAAADPAPTADHWTTTTVTLDDTSYVVDSRDWFIDVDDLIEDNYLRGKLESASPDNSPAGTGSYSWYVDANGKVRSMLYSSPTSDTDGYQGVYP